VAPLSLTIVDMDWSATGSYLRTVSTRQTAAAFLLGIFLTTSFLPAQAADITVDESQQITAHGDSESLRDVVVQLCEEARIDLRGFAATDRTVSVAYDELPLDRFLSRLLREESYVVGLKGDKNGVRIAWLRVMGPESSTGGLKFGDERPTSHFGVDKSVLETAWASEDESARKAATTKIVQKVVDDPAILDDFLAISPATTLEEIGDQPHAVTLLKNLMVTTDDNRRKFQIMGLVQSIRSRQEREDAAYQPLRTLKALELPEE
jgi:hypothetical protein